jgi:hypothetical protein
MIEDWELGRGKPLFLTCSNQSSKFPFIFRPFALFVLVCGPDGGAGT